MVPRKNHRWSPRIPTPSFPSFLLSFASFSCIISYLESCEPWQNDGDGACVRARDSPPRPRICHGANAMGIPRGPIRGPKWQKESWEILFIPAGNNRSVYFNGHANRRLLILHRYAPHLFPWLGHVSIEIPPLSLSLSLSLCNSLSQIRHFIDPSSF